jgi:hypothetical protein
MVRSRRTGVVAEIYSCCTACELFSGRIPAHGGATARGVCVGVSRTFFSGEVVLDLMHVLAGGN